MKRFLKHAPIGFYLMTICFLMIAGISGCSNSNPDQTAIYEGTKKGCVLKYKARGYQQWEAVDLCKRLP
jgi:hypothetical protein